MSNYGKKGAGIVQLDIRHKALLFIGAAGIATSLLLGGLLLTGVNTAENLIHGHVSGQ